MIPEHSWEMGRKNYSKKKIIDSINKSGLVIEKQYTRLFYPYHYYFVLRKNKVL